MSKHAMMREVSRQKSRSKSKIKKIFTALAALFAFGLIFSGFALAALVRDLPDPSRLADRKVVESTKIYDRTGEVLLYEIHGEEKRTVIPFENIPASVRAATLVLEDANFYQHRGVDFRGIARAFVVDVFSGNYQQGGSTITQQLIKNSILGKERTIKRKVKEALLAIILDARYSKDEILNLYLNQIPYGSNAYGIEAASQTYFSTSTPNLTVAQAATVASLPKAPSYYLNHLDELMARQKIALDRMEKAGYLSAGEAKKAREEPIDLRLKAHTGIRAPHFSLYIKELLAQKYGEDAIEEGGLTVRTTLDWKLQEAAERIVKEGVEFNEKVIKASNGALVALDPKTGDILAMVGSRDWFIDESLPNGCTTGVNCVFEPKVNNAIRLHQPGSAFKPFVYAAAFKKGYLPDTVVFDVPTEFHPLCSPDGIPETEEIKPEDCYHPGNYDETFRGPVSLRRAIAQSLNVPSVKVLYLAGINDAIETAEAMGISTIKDRSRFGLSLVLGGADVRLTEMTSAYGIFAADGVLHPQRAILSITENNRILEEAKDDSRQALDTNIARMINDVLSDDDARVPVFQPHGSLWLQDRPVAAKTGTTQEYRDAWTIGYTPSLVVGVWVGNNDNTSIQQKGSGVLAAAPMWKKFMQEATKDTLPEFFEKPDIVPSQKPVANGLWQGETIVSIDKISKKLATEFTPQEMKEFAGFGEPHDPLFWIDRSDPLGAPPANPFNDPQFKNWETSFQRWRASSGFSPRPLSAIPKEADDVHTPDMAPKISITSAADEGENYAFSLSMTSRFSIKEINATAMDSLVASAGASQTGIVLLRIKKSLLGDPPASVIFRAYDTVGNRAEVIFPFGGESAPAPVESEKDE